MGYVGRPQAASPWEWSGEFIVEEGTILGSRIFPFARLGDELKVFDHLTDRHPCLVRVKDTRKCPSCLLACVCLSVRVLIERLSSEDGPTLYQWDHKNRLTKVTHPDGQETLYDYCPACPLGKLSKMTRKDGSTVEWTWDGLSMVEEADTREGESAYFSGLAVQRDGEWYYLMMDAMGSVFQVTDEFGDVVNEFDWDSWGNELSGTFGQPGAVCQTGWQGKRFDEEQELFYSVARWYDQRTGRFTQPDPLEGAGIVAVGGEGYGWPQNDPVIVVDQIGLGGRGQMQESDLEQYRKDYEHALDFLIPIVSPLKHLFIVGQDYIIWSQFTGLPGIEADRGNKSIRHSPYTHCTTICHIAYALGDGLETLVWEHMLDSECYLVETEDEDFNRYGLECYLAHKDCACCCEKKLDEHGAGRPPHIRGESKPWLLIGWLRQRLSGWSL